MCVHGMRVHGNASQIAGSRTRSLPLSMMCKRMGSCGAVKEEEEEEGLFKADAVNEEEEKEDEESLFIANAVNEEGSERERATQV